MAVQRDANGRLLPGSTLAKGAGRPQLPDWLRAEGEHALRYLVDVAKGLEDVDPKLRLRAAEVVVERVYGKASLDIDLADSRQVDKLRDLLTLDMDPDTA